MNTANDCYRKHYGGGVAIGATPLDEYSRKMLGPGKRYSLVREALARNPPTGGLLAEIGAAGGGGRPCLFCQASIISIASSESTLP